MIAPYDDDDDLDDAEMDDELTPDGASTPDGGIELEDGYQGNQPVHELRARSATPDSAEPPKKRRSGPAPGAPRVSKAEQTMRIATVAQMRINGFKRADVHAYVNEKLLMKWAFPSERTIDRLIEKADAMIKSEAVRDVQAERGKAISRLDDLYRKCTANKLFGTALRVQRAINRMQGLDAPLNLRHSNDPENPMPAPTNGPFIVLVQEVEEG